MNRLTMIAMLAVSVAALGCGGKKDKDKATAVAPTGSAPAAGGTMSQADFEANMGKAMAMFTAMGDAADKAGGDCGVLASSIDKILVDNNDFIEHVKKWDADPSMKAKGDEWMKAHQSEMMGPMMKVGAAGQKCSTDAKFMAVMEKLENLGGS